MLNNKDFYPTPNSLIEKMLSKIDRMHKFNNILEPSAGDGAILNYLKEELRYGRRQNVYAIEKDESLQKILLQDGHRLIDNDFLSYSGGEQFDLIIANFPFSDGEKHLKKAIDLMFNGEIVCLVNAETIKNPCTNLRKEIIGFLNDNNASIEFIKNAFSKADRQTDVEVALIHVKITNSVENTLFNNMEKEDLNNIKLEEEGALTTQDDIHNLVEYYNIERERVTEQIVSFYKHYSYVSNYLDLNVKGEDCRSDSDSSLTEIMQDKINNFVRQLKKEYWIKTIKTKEVSKLLPSSKAKEVRATLESFYEMSFSEKNIKILMNNLMTQFPKLINKSVEDLFDNITSYSLRDNRWAEYKSNIHYFNAWKSNDGYKVNKKIILPFYSLDYSGNIEVSYKHEEFFADIDRVINYFSLTRQVESTKEVCQNAIRDGQTRKIETTHFLISFFKKGTIHFEFKCLDTLRRFNIEACKLKNMLPMDYSNKDFNKCNQKEREIIQSFEGKKNYKAEESYLLKNTQLKLIA